MNLDELKTHVAEAWTDREKLKERQYAKAVKETIELLDRGALRVASKGAQGWQVEAWVMQAINLYFAVAEMKTMPLAPFEFHDKLPLKTGLAEAGVRVVPPGTVRYGAFLERGTVVMPGYVNIGAWVGSGTMVDTWATVGSCAQVGRNVHLSGGVGLGGVLEPPGAQPVIIEDGCFIGSRCIVVEGVLVEEEAVLGAGVTLTASTPIIDVRGSTEVMTKGRIPPRSVVIPGMRPRKFPAGEYLTPCAMIIGERSVSTDRKTSLNSALRDFGVAV